MSGGGGMGLNRLRAGKREGVKGIESFRQKDREGLSEGFLNSGFGLEE